MTSPDRQPVILVVDDEEMVLVSIKSFLMLETDYDVITANSPPEGLEVVNHRIIDLVISDYLIDRKSTRLNSSHIQKSRMPSSA